MRVDVFPRARCTTLLAGALLVALLAVGADPAPVRAQSFNVSADLPLSLTFASGDPTDRVSGAVVDVAFPFLLGVGTTQVTGWYGVHRVVYSTIHGLFDLPLGAFTLRGGLGLGRARPVISGPASYDAAPVTEVYVRGGLVLFPGLDLHVGAHVLDGESKITAPVPGTLDITATLYTIGLTLGF